MNNLECIIGLNIPLVEYRVTVHYKSIKNVARLLSRTYNWRRFAITGGPSFNLFQPNTAERRPVMIDAYTRAACRLEPRSAAQKRNSIVRSITNRCRYHSPFASTQLTVTICHTAKSSSQDSNPLDAPLPPPPPKPDLLYTQS